MMPEISGESVPMIKMVIGTFFIPLEIFVRFLISTFNFFYY